MSVVELAPVVKSVDVRRSAADAFRIFTTEISSWWPKETHTRARTAAGERTEHVIIEPRVGGRVYEKLSDGRELEWGEVAVFEPVTRFAFTWRLGRPAAQTTDVTITFEPTGPESCRVTLTHENWERMGEEGPTLRNNYNNGWEAVFKQGFGGYANRIKGE